MIVGNLPSAELRRRLTAPGLRIRIGPVVAQIQSSSEVVRSCIALHYAAHELAAADEFADFRVSLQESRGLARLFRPPKAIFGFDGTPPFQPLPAHQGFALLEWGLNWAIAAYCHQYLIVHAAIVERDDRALLLPAPPGSGKSTLCAALVARGWRLLSDELALIDIDSGRAIPIPRPISLKNQSIALIGGFWPEAKMSAIVPDTLKGSVVHVQPPPANVQASRSFPKLGWIVLPRYEADRPTELVPLSRGVGFMQLVDNAFNYSMHGRRGFEVLSDIVAGAHAFQFHYGGSLDDAVRTFDSLLQ